MERSVPMLANFEKRNYNGNERVWIGRYRNLQNLPHWHLESELLYVESGAVIVSDNHEKYHLAQGDAIFLQGGDIHYIKSEPDSIVAITLFDSSLISGMLKDHRLACAKLEHPYPIQTCFEHMQEELTSHTSFYELKLRSLITGLMVDIFRQEELAVQIQPDKEKHSSIDNYKNLLSEIESKYDYITFSDAADFMKLSEPYFSKFFRKVSGMTFSQYLNTVRLEHAIELLKNNTTHMPITEIAAQCGFDTIRHFNRVFKDITGMSPRQMPSDYVLDVRPIRAISEAFDPTLKNSELL